MLFLENETGNYIWGTLDIYFRNCRMCSANWGWCSFYCQQLYFRPRLENYSLNLFDSHSKDENRNLSSSGTTVPLKFDTLYSLKNHIRSVYYKIFSLTLLFQKQFIKVHCTTNAKNLIKYELKNKWFSRIWEKDWVTKKKKKSCRCRK